jgi:hypothetical protein
MILASVVPAKCNSPESIVIKQIDFSNWIFTEGFDGYYEIAKENNFFEKDGHHPNLKAGMIWGNLINERLNLKGNKNDSNTLE